MTSTVASAPAGTTTGPSLLIGVGRLRLVLASALMPFLELALIRWLGANVVHLGYFSNIVLLGSFLGVGVGFLRSRVDRPAPAYFPVVLAALVTFVRFVPVTVERSGKELIYFTSLSTTGPPVHRWSVVAVNLAVLALLIVARRDFTAVSERRGRIVALRVFVVMGSVSVVAGLFLTARTTDSSLLERFEQVFVGLLGFTPDLAFHGEHTGALTEIGLNTLGALTALLTLLTLLAPARKSAGLAPD